MPRTPATAAAPDVTLAGPTQAAAGGHAVLPGVTHVWQRWNNCGPSAALMALSAFGVHRDQLQLAARVKPDREDTNVTPDEIAALVRAEGLSAVVRYHGNRDVVRALVASGVPVIAEQWIDVDGRGEMGHYRVVIGFDDREQAFLVHDSYYGPNRRHAYDDFDLMWRPFVGAYVAVFDPALEPSVRLALGTDWDEARMWARARADHEVWALAEPRNAWAHFALGEVRSRVGDHGAAVESFERAVAIGLPFRAFWYQFGYYRALYASEAYERLLAHADVTLATMDGANLEESRYWRGMALAALGRNAEALREFETALTYNPLFEAARLARDAVLAGAAVRP
jgi:tetratricopeptide (TPR) repeat protein